jgi:hypothetical protein
MSLSNEKRFENMGSALLIMLKELGNEPISDKEFEPDTDIFKDIIPTTWHGLVERY